MEREREIYRETQRDEVLDDLWLVDILPGVQFQIPSAAAGGVDLRNWTVDISYTVIFGTSGEEVVDRQTLTGTRGGR